MIFVNGDLQREQTTPPDQTYLLIYLRPPSPPALSALTLLPQKQEYPYATSVISCECCFFPFPVWYHFKGICVIGKLVSISQ